MLLLQVKELSKNENGKLVVDQISFEQLPLQRIAIAGETGSGKTSLLKMIGGYLQPTSGEILFNNQRVIGPEEQLLPGHPQIAFLSQHFELRSNYKVGDWLSMVNKLTKESAMLVYKVCRIDHLLKRRTEDLSGGERQRIALARLLTTAPKLLLLDEPFSNLDRSHKLMMKAVIAEIGEKLNTSCILVSHDAFDVLPWADILLVMQNGRIVQMGTPQELYHKPLNEYVAALLGNYMMIDLEKNPTLIGLFQASVQHKKLLVRPEQVKILNDVDKGMSALIDQVLFYGSHDELILSCYGVKLICYAPVGRYRIGDNLSIFI